METNAHTAYCYAPDDARLHNVLRRICARVPFYLSCPDAVSRASGVEALREFPILGKDDLIRHGAALYDLPVEHAVLISETSGTTGAGVLPTPRSLEEMNWNSQNLGQIMARTLSAGSDRVAVLHPVIMSPFADACCVALARLGIPYLRVFSVLPLCDYKRILRILFDYRVSCVLTTPTLAAKLCFEREKQLGAAAPWPVRRFLLTGELLSDPWLKQLERVSGQAQIQPFVYGSSESATCMRGCRANNYHPIDDFVFELVPAKSTDSAATLLVTWLNPGIRPLVRYRTDDLFRLVEHCECGDGIAFRAAGRSVQQRLRAGALDALENSLLEHDLPLYHYELALRPQDSNLALFTVAPVASTSLEYVQRAARNALPELGELRVYNNPPGHEFLSEVVRPKMSRVTHADA